MEKMSLIVFKETGHVLGAFTRTVNADGAVSDAADVVGDGLQLRDATTGKMLVAVPPSHLEVKLVDRRDDVILAHRNFVLDDGVITLGSPQTWTAPTYAANQLSFTVPTAPADDGKAWVEIDDGSGQPIILSVDMTANAANGSVQVTLSPGEYGLLIVAPQNGAFVGLLTV